MLHELLSFDVPHLYNIYDRSEILCNLEALTISACRITGSDLEGLRDIVELDFEPDLELEDPKIVYEKSYDELIEIIGGYNFYISENKLPEPLIQLVVDDEKTNLLKGGIQYPIYKVILCNGLT